MLTGYNTDIKHEGVIYHVQTEDGGTDNPVIVSLIYRGGRILASKKTSYAHMLGMEDLVPKLRDLLENQHKRMIKAILTGAPISDQGKASPAAPPPKTAPQPAPPGPAQAPTQPQKTPEEAKPPSSPKPPLEVPPETAAETPTNRTTEKNLDQVILEYLASEIDKD